MSQFRKEFKYILSESTALSIRHALTPFVHHDPYSKREKSLSYEVHSLYMDTPEKRFFYEKLDGVNQRVKVRIRTYQKIKSPQSSIFLEFKQRTFDTFYKKREKISLNSYHTLLDKSNKKRTKDPLFQKYPLLSVFRTLKPTVLISFYREAFFANHSNDIRINFDRSLNASVSQDLFTGHGRGDILHGAVIFEIKFPILLPSWLTDTIKQHNLKISSFSKYCTSLAHCDKFEQFSLIDSFNTYV